MQSETQGHLNSRKTSGAGKCNDLLQPDDGYLGEWWNVLANDCINKCMHAGVKYQIPFCQGKNVMDSYARSF